MDLPRKLRPNRLEDVVGQPHAIKAINKWITSKQVPHCILFAGPSGTGKTTLARIVAMKVLKCSKIDFVEINCAKYRGIDVARDILDRTEIYPMGGENKVWLLDEVHMSSGEFQNSLLKCLEEPPDHAYFMLATTNPSKIIATILSRSTQILLKPVPDKELTKLVNSIITKEKAEKLSEDVLERLVEVAEGSPRRVLVLLQQILGMDEEDQLKSILQVDVKQQAIKIAQLLINPRTQWIDMQKVIGGVDEEAEQLRRMVLGYASSVLLGPAKKLHARASLIISIFRDHWFDCGRAGLIGCCFEVIHQKK